MKKKTKDILVGKIKAKAEQEIGNIDYKIEKMIESAMLSLIGLEKNSRTGLEIDHCNGRNSVLIDAFRNLAVKKAEKMARGMKFDDGKMGIYRAAFDREYSSQLNRCIKSEASIKASADAKEFIGRINVTVEDYLDLEKI